MKVKMKARARIPLMMLDLLFLLLCYLCTRDPTDVPRELSISNIAVIL